MPVAVDVGFSMDMLVREQPVRSDLVARASGAGVAGDVPHHAEAVGPLRRVGLALCGCPLRAYL